MWEIKFGPIPPIAEGGFHFPQKLPDGGVFHITGSTKDELDQKILRYRMDNHVEVGNPPRESTDYLCSRFPRICREVRSTEADESPENKTLRARVTNWTLNRYSQTQAIKDLEEDETAKKRIQVCQSCPAKQNWKEGCPPCIVETERMLYMVSQGRTDNLPDAGGCSVAGHDNAVAALLKPEMLAYRKRFANELPKHCWMLNLE